MALEDLRWYGLLLWIFFVIVVVWSLTAIATVNCHNMGKNSRINSGCMQALEGWKYTDGILILDELFVEVLLSLPPHLLSQSLIRCLSLAISSYIFFILFIAVSLFTFPLLSQHSLSQSLFGWLIYSSIHSFINSTSCPSLPFFTHSLSSFSRFIHCLSSSSLLSISLACWSSCTVSIRSSRRFLGGGEYT